MFKFWWQVSLNKGTAYVYKKTLKTVFGNLKRSIFTKRKDGSIETSLDPTPLFWLDSTFNFRLYKNSACLLICIAQVRKFKKRF